MSLYRNCSQLLLECQPDRPEQQQEQKGHGEVDPYLEPPQLPHPVHHDAHLDTQGIEEPEKTQKRL